jgi:hypothetical protein
MHQMQTNHALERQGGRVGARFHQRIDAKDNAWLTSYGGKSIAVFDKNGKPLTPPEGITFGGKLGLMQGVIVTRGGGCLGDEQPGDSRELLQRDSGNVFDSLRRTGRRGLLRHGDDCEDAADRVAAHAAV